MAAADVENKDVGGGVKVEKDVAVSNTVEPPSVVATETVEVVTAVTRVGVGLVSPK